ncbi:MAG TPA: M2 family metallopeptidase [Longimicrobiales bacterium]|nr:M2 family metallopeptidase [Longimicrobiales bacterium]
MPGRARRGTPAGRPAAPRNTEGPHAARRPSLRAPAPAVRRVHQRSPAPPAAPSAAQAAAFVEAAEARLALLAEQSSRAGWVAATFITHDTEILSAEASEKYLAAATELAQEAARFEGLELPFDVARKLDLLRVGITTPAPADSAATARVARLAAALEAAYGRGKWCLEGAFPAALPALRAAAGEDACLDLQEMTALMAESRDEAVLRAVWTGWRTISPPMRDDYRRFAELMNEGARELGFADTGELWRSGYDMSPAAFAREVERLWLQVKPLYDALHCHVRAELGARFGTDVVAQDGPIPAHLLGNMWAQQWANIYDLVAPGAADPGYDLTALLAAHDYDARGMVETGEAFFTSLGFEALPETFWERSLFTQPVDHDVVCHASAWNIDGVDDLRIKMCIQPTAEDFQTIHHELGHNFYQRAYNERPFLYQDGAHDGFHEAIGDAIALSITPDYLVELGLLEEAPDASHDLGLLLRDALDKVAFLPFGLLVDQGRWQVFSGDIPADQYNAGWWELRERYQGIAPPDPRGDAYFDPGAKYHIPGNTPYTRYFLAHILQFQMHAALCAAAGYEGPLHRCTIYGSEEAGRRLAAMLEVGRSRPWPEALRALTGTPEMDATAILDYFAPLHAWLEEQNRGRVCGW